MTSIQMKMDEERGAREARYLMKDIYTSEYGAKTYSRVVEDLGKRIRAGGRSEKALSRILTAVDRGHPAITKMRGRRSRQSMDIAFQLFHAFDTTHDKGHKERAVHLDDIAVKIPRVGPVEMMVNNHVMTQHALARIFGRGDGTVEDIINGLKLMRLFFMDYGSWCIDHGLKKAPWTALPMPYGDGLLICEFRSGVNTHTTVATMTARTFIGEKQLHTNQRQLLELIAEEGFDAYYHYPDVAGLTRREP